MSDVVVTTLATGLFTLGGVYLGALLNSLNEGYRNHHFLADSEFVSDAITCDKYQMYPSINQEFPFLIKSVEDGNVVDALDYFKNEDNNLDAVDYLNPMNEWI